MPGGLLRVCFVCSGNICRSPMGEVVLQQLAEEQGLGDHVLATSAGTGDWHIGERADHRTLTALARRGYDGSGHRAQLFDPQWLPSLDLVLALDRGHLRALRAWARAPQERSSIALLRSFDPALAGVPGYAATLPVTLFTPVPRGAGPVPAPEETPLAAELDVPDPYYSDLDAFDLVLDQVEAACRGLLIRLEDRLAAQALDEAR